MISRRDWWIGVSIVTAALLFHGAWPRYEWHAASPKRGLELYARFDRWTGVGQIGPYTLAPGYRPPISADDVSAIESFTPDTSWRYVSVVAEWPRLDLLAVAVIALVAAGSYIAWRRARSW